MKEVLILGGSGFIGFNIVECLVNRGDCNVTVADVKNNSKLTKLLNHKEKSNRLKFIKGDFSDKKAFLSFKRKFDEIYMLAAVVGVNKTIQNPYEVINTNTMLTMNTLDWISRNPVKKILFASSSENYAGTSDLFDIDIPTSENVPLTISDIKHPRWTYAITKIHGESSFIHSAKKYGYKCTIVRYQNIIGPDMGFGHAIPHIVERFINQLESPIKVYGYDQTRAFCHVDDAVNGTILAMESSNSDGEIYHIGNEQEITMEKLTKYIGDLVDYKGGYENARTYPGSVKRRCPDIMKAKNDLGYEPRYDWKTAVEMTVLWYKNYFESGNQPNEGGFVPPELIIKKKELLMQRVFDIIISLTFLLVLFPIFLLISLILKYTGEGEILYFQERVGMNGAKFSLIKFATMLKNSPNFGAGNLTLKDDPRVLPFGKFLRKTKINELPQLVNIFIGDMSIVGPRPMVSDTYQHYSSDAQNKLNLIQPGLTGIGSIIFRDEEKFLEKASDPAEFYKKIIIPYKSELESWYVDNKSFNNYIKCIFVTAWVIFFPKSRLIKIAFKDLPIKPDELQ